MVFFVLCACCGAVNLGMCAFDEKGDRRGNAGNNTLLRLKMSPIEGQTAVR